MVSLTSGHVVSLGLVGGDARAESCPIAGASLENGQKVS